MKNVRSIILVFVIALSISKTANANVVSEQTAKNLAINFFRVTAHVSSKTALTADLKFAKTETDGTVDFYVFDIAPKGFVIVSADDNIVPVIGYSTESNFNNNFAKTPVADWMNHAGTHIHTAIQQHILADSRINNMWASYTQANSQPQLKSAPATVAPLLTTTWDQGNFYNQYAPYNTADQQRCLAGCAATAMAQIMKYWNYPATGTGSYSYNNSQPMYRYNYGNQSANFGTTTYNWAAMPNSLDTTNTDVAGLVYQCAVSVAMDFGDLNQGGSGAYVLQADVASWQHSAQKSYATNFNYNGNTLQGVYAANYTSTDWLNLIKGELNEGRPVQYQGDNQGSGGHTWVCDGYDANDMLHMNWGWGGNYNGYFSVTSLSAGGMNFSNDEEALIGIEPAVPVSLSLRFRATSICPGDSTVLYGIGPSAANTTYTWTPAAGLSCSTCATTFAKPLVTTVYTLTIDSSGFKNSASVKITVRPSVQIQDVFGTNVSCYGADNGSASVTATGGSSSLSYLWSNGQSSSSAVNLFAGFYAITVSDVSGCSATSSFSVSQPDSIHISLSTNQTAHTIVYGRVVANVTGGTENFSYLWNNGETSSSISNLSNGIYTLTVTDNNSCIKTASISINETTTDIQAVSNDLSFNVYPNPSKGQVTVALQNVTNGATLSVKNVLGQTVVTRTISDLQNQLDLSSMADGSYVVELKDGEKSFVKQIIVKK